MSKEILSSVLQESDFLYFKISNLKALINTIGVYDKLPSQQQSLLHRQLASMENYSRILNERIELLVLEVPVTIEEAFTPYEVKVEVVSDALKEIIRKGKELKNTAGLIDKTTERYGIEEGELDNSKRIIKLVKEAGETLDFLNW